MSDSAPKPLMGCGIVITRPAHQAQSLAAKVRVARDGKEQDVTVAVGERPQPQRLP